MRLIMTHGYMLSGTGSNVYVQSLCRALVGEGHDAAPDLPGAGPPLLRLRERARDGGRGRGPRPGRTGDVVPGPLRRLRPRHRRSPSRLRLRRLPGMARQDLPGSDTGGTGRLPRAQRRGRTERSRGIRSGGRDHQPLRARTVDSTPCPAGQRHPLREHRPRKLPAVPLPQEREVHGPHPRGPGGRHGDTGPLLPQRGHGSRRLPRPHRQDQSAPRRRRHGAVQPRCVRPRGRREAERRPRPRPRPALLAAARPQEFGQRDRVGWCVA